MKNAKTLICSLLLSATIHAETAPTAPTAPNNNPNVPPNGRPNTEQTLEKEVFLGEIYDPWIGFNKRMFRFNYNFDRFVFLPVVHTYEWIMPNPAEKGVTNFFNNLGEINNGANALLQGKFKRTGWTVARFAINSTVGILGLFDVSTKLNIRRQNEDLGQTLATYGVGNGPFIVLPLLGPSNLRDTGGFVGDTLFYNWVDPLNLDHNESWEIPVMAIKTIDNRHKVPYRYFESGSPFEYELVRLMYYKARKIQIDK